MGILVCPNCGKTLVKDEKNRLFQCANGHCFDLAKEGYVNLLVGSKSGENRGDSKASARARHEFLEKGYYSCLKEVLQPKLHGTVLDICCGEGYYDVPDAGALSLSRVKEFYGFDLSKEMVRLAAKRGTLAEKRGGVERDADNLSDRKPSYQYFVGNLASIPVKEHSVDVALHLFAPFHEEQFAKILKPNGVLYSVIPGENHLYELKEVVYDTPYKNDEQAPKTTGLVLTGRTRVSDTITVPKEDLLTLFSMTPYYYRTSELDRNKLMQVETLTVTVEFIILEYHWNN